MKTKTQIEKEIQSIKKLQIKIFHDSLKSSRDFFLERMKEVYEYEIQKETLKFCLDSEVQGK